MNLSRHANRPDNMIIERLTKEVNIGRRGQGNGCTHSRVNLVEPVEDHVYG
jgi:hypothetical protein